MTARYTARRAPPQLRVGRPCVLMAGRKRLSVTSKGAREQLYRLPSSTDPNASLSEPTALWTGAHISQSPESKTEFNGIDGLRPYITTVPASSLPALPYFGAICPARVL